MLLENIWKTSGFWIFWRGKWINEKIEQSHLIYDFEIPTNVLEGPPEICNRFVPNPCKLFLLEGKLGQMFSHELLEKVLDLYSLIAVVLETLPLTRFRSLFPFNTPGNIKGFLIFAGGLEREYWLERIKLKSLRLLINQVALHIHEKCDVSV